jgi:predicted nucleotidyltransferase
VTDPVPEMVRIIVERFRPERIVLFGSRARGAAHPSSDVDLLVVARVDGSKRRFAAEIDEALAPLRVSKDVVVATPDEVERSREAPGSISRTAMREGKIVYERG